MNLDIQTLMEIEDYVKHLDESIGLKPETILDIEKAINKYRRQIKKAESESENPKNNFPTHGENCKFTHTKCEKCYIEYIEWSCRD